MYSWKLNSNLGNKQQYLRQKESLWGKILNISEYLTRHNISIQPIPNTPLFDQLPYILLPIPPVICTLKLKQHGYVQNIIFCLMQVGICGWGGVGTNSLLPPRELMVLWPNHTTSLPRRPHFHFLSVKNWPILFTLCSNKIAIFTPMKVHQYYKTTKKQRKRMTSLCHQLRCSSCDSINTFESRTICDNTIFIPMPGKKRCPHAA